MSAELLPDFLADAAPEAAARLELARRRTLAALAARGYAQIVPPLIEHLDVFLQGRGRGLETRLVKFTDTLSGRALAVRADHTPQIARFDRHRPARGARRFCYCGPAVHARPPLPWLSREQMQAGAELYGAPAAAGDKEILLLAAAVLRANQARDVFFNIGHAGFVRALLARAVPARREKLRRALARRDAALIKEAAGGGLRADLLFLINADNEPEQAAARAARWRARFKNAAFAAMLDELLALAATAKRAKLAANLDLTESHDYGYHTGAVFCAYVGGEAMARGGRYAHDDGESGAGFSVDLRRLAAVDKTAAKKSPAKKSKRQ